MKADINERITRIGPDTPCGAPMRRCWQPAALVDDFDPRLDPRTSGRPVKALRLPGHDQVLFCVTSVARSGEGDGERWPMRPEAATLTGPDTIACIATAQGWGGQWQALAAAKRAGAIWLAAGEAAS